VHLDHCRSGTEEQYAEKEQLLHEIVDIQRDVEEKPRKKEKGFSRAWCGWSLMFTSDEQPASVIHCSDQQHSVTTFGKHGWASRCWKSVCCSVTVSNLCAVGEEAEAEQATAWWRRYCLPADEAGSGGKMARGGAGNEEKRDLADRKLEFLVSSKVNIVEILHLSLFLLQPGVKFVHYKIQPVICCKGSS